MSKKTSQTHTKSSDLREAKPHPKGIVTPKRKSLDADLRLIAKNSFRLIDLLLYVRVNSYGHVGTLDVERNLKQLKAMNQTNKNSK